MTKRKWAVVRIFVTGDGRELHKVKGLRWTRRGAIRYAKWLQSIFAQAMAAAPPSSSITGFRVEVWARELVPRDLLDDEITVRGA